MKLRALIGAALVLPSAILAAACGSEEHARPESAPPVTVTTVAARRVAAAEMLEAGGVIEARDSATLSSRVLAPVREVRVKAGDRVRAGQVLVVLDGRDLAAQASQASASASAAGQAVDAAKTDLAAATSEHKVALAWRTRIAALHAKNSATAQELDDADGRLAGAIARIEGAKARVEQAGSQVAATRAAADAASVVRGFATLTAPFDGMVTETLADPGDMASPGTPLVRVDSAGAAQVKVLVDEGRAAFIAPRQTVTIVIGAGERAHGGETVEGTVTEVAREIAAGARAFSVKVALPKGLEARTGTFARVRFGGASRQALTVSPSALLRQGQVVSAYVVEGDVARLRLVRTGADLSEGIEVLAGVDEGERVITSPPRDLFDGRRVTLAAPAGGAGDRK